MPITNLFLLPGDHLLPCPFCNGMALELQNTHTACYSIKCLDVDCGAEVHGESFTGNYRSENIPRKRHEQAKDSAIATWNKRAPQSAPSPADRAVAEVMALPASVIPSTIETPGDYLGEIGMIGVRIRGMLSAREMLVRIARVAIAGVLACDAKGGA